MRRWWKNRNAVGQRRERRRLEDANHLLHLGPSESLIVVNGKSPLP